MSSRFLEYVESGPPLLDTSSKTKMHKLNASFRFTNTNVTIANTVRREILNHTPSVGFRTEPYDKSEVEILINTTPLVNEMVAHRIGMIPICADPNTFNPSLYEFKLDKENKTNEMMDIHASDIQVFMRNPDNALENPTELNSKEFFPPDPITGDTVLITRLRPQWNPTAKYERLQFKAKASISTGKENSRWSPVCQVSYEYTPNKDPAHVHEVFVNWLNANKKIENVNALMTEKRDELLREFHTMEVQRCYMRNDKNEPYDFTFHIESVGVQSVPQIVLAGLKACEQLVGKYSDADTALPPNMVVQVGDSRFASIDIILQNENHTLGNLLETYVVENHIDGSEQPKINYAGYKVPHPLRPEMFLRLDTRTQKEVEDNITVEKEEQMKRAQNVFANACRKLANEFRTLQTEWMQLVSLTPVSL